MMVDELDAHDGLGLAALIRNRSISPLELMDRTIARIEALNPTLNFMTNMDFEGARTRARAAPGDGAFAGLPWLLKDLVLSHAGIPLTSGSRFLKDYVPPHDSLSIARLKTLGMIYVGSTNVPEFGINLESSNMLFGSSRNPWNIDRTPGGSSGGAAAAVSARVVPLAHASDGGGSTRVPASYCGLVGLKPSRGRTSYFPDYADVWYGCGTDSCVTLSVRDTAAYADAFWGSLPGEPYEIAPLDRPLLQEVGVDPGKLRIGLQTVSPAAHPASAEAREAAEKAAALCAALGHTVEPVTLDIDFARFAETFMRMIGVLTGSALRTVETLMGRTAAPDELQPILWAVRKMGEQVSGFQHADDTEFLRTLGRDVCMAYAPYDIVITPTTPEAATAVRDPDQRWDDLDRYRDRVFGLMGFVGPVSMSGLPAISLPLHWGADGMPYGTQFVARRGQEDRLIRLAAQLEAASPWFDRRPPLSTVG